MLEKIKENIFTTIFLILVIVAILWPTSQVDDPEEAKSSSLAAATKIDEKSPPKRVPETPLTEKSFEQVIKERETSVAFIRGLSSSGTGFMVDGKIVATNRHVIEEEFEKNITIYFPSAEKKFSGPFQTKVLFVSRDHDLAFLSVQEGLDSFPIDSTYSFRRGQEIIVIGNPGAGGNITLENAISKGVMSSKVVIDSHEYFQLGIAINPGNSGGPVIDNRGACIGVATLKATQKEAIAFCIPPKFLQSELNQLINSSEKEKSYYSSRHRMRVCYKKLQTAMLLQVASLQVYSLALDECVKKRVDMQMGLNMAQKIVSEKVGNTETEILRGVREEISKISSDAIIDSNIRIRFADFWTNYQEMKALIENPLASMEYANSIKEVTEKHKRLTDSLGVLIGM